MLDEKLKTSLALDICFSYIHNSLAPKNTCRTPCLLLTGFDVNFLIIAKHHTKLLENVQQVTCYDYRKLREEQHHVMELLGLNIRETQLDGGVEGWQGTTRNPPQK